MFVDSRPLALSNAELGKLDLCNGGLGSHLLEPLKSSWHTDALSDPVTFRCIPLAFADLCSLATGGELPEVNIPSTAATRTHLNFIQELQHQSSRRTHYPHALFRTASPAG